MLYLWCKNCMLDACMRLKQCSYYISVSDMYKIKHFVLQILYLASSFLWFSMYGAFTVLQWIWKHQWVAPDKYTVLFSESWITLSYLFVLNTFYFQSAELLSTLWWNAMVEHSTIACFVLWTFHYSVLHAMNISPFMLKTFPPSLWWNVPPC